MKSTAMTRTGSENIANAAHSVTGAAEDYDGLIELVGERRFVLIGEASHGTHEPLERAALWDRIEPPETYPTGV